MSDRTRLLLLCNPSNPTGQVHDRSLTERLMEFARRHDLWVLSDEIYGEIVFDGDHASALPHDADERLILVTGMSKSFAMTGFRVGFTRARADYIELAAKLQEPLVSCGVGFAQKAAVAALEGPGECVRDMCGQYRGAAGPRPGDPARVRPLPLHAGRGLLPPRRHLLHRPSIRTRSPCG